MPAGISLIAGDEKAMQPQSPRVIRWTRSRDKDTRDATSTPHDCSSGRMLRLVVTFPSCWDGHTLEGAAQTNAVYPVDGRCPASAHVDFINGWDQALLARNTSVCIAAHLRCGPVTGTGAVPSRPDSHEKPTGVSLTVRICSSLER